MAEALIIDEAIRVVVSPSQASYFAGETFAVTITITNLRTPQVNPTPRSVSQPYTHKRGAHSVSYVPMARPPTSPGIRTALVASSARNGNGNDVPVRKGIVGLRISEDSGSEQSSDATRSQLGSSKSLSVSLASSEVHDSVLSDPKARVMAADDVSTYSGPNHPRISSPLARSTTVPMNHPHARKQSVMFGENPKVEDGSFVAPLPALNSSSSTFSLSLDPISEGAMSPMAPETPAVASPHAGNSFSELRPPLISSSTSMESAIHSRSGLALPNRLETNARRPPHLTNGRTPKARKIHSSSFSIPNSEVILYSYAQLIGTLTITTPPNSLSSPEQVRAMQELRNTLTKTKGIGGGSMDITSFTPQSLPYGHAALSSSRLAHSRSSSLSTNLLSFLSSTSLPSSPTSPTSPTAWAPSHRARSPSVFSNIFSPSSSTSTPSLAGLGIGLGSASEQEDFDTELPLPTIEVQPQMLAVDLTLPPGESRCYTYQLQLPRNLPPTYRGKCLRFSYEFVLGVCRALSPSTSGSTSHSRVLKVPIRLYNHVVVDAPPSPYDLLWPMQAQKRPIDVLLTDISRDAQRAAYSSPTRSPDPNAHPCTHDELQAYAKSLAAQSASDVSALSAEDADTDADTTVRAEGWAARNREGPLGLGAVVEEAERELSCREAVEILTRNPKKLSYDVNKDGVKVAVLTFAKSAYRLGETVLGVVELNGRASRARVLKLSALLESHESLPECLAPGEPAGSRQLRRVHAEHHSSFVANTLRTTFSLDIPPDASPAFEVDVGEFSTPKSRPGGLEWKVRLCLFVAVASAQSREGVDGVRLKHLARVGQKGAWGTAWVAPASIAPSERPPTASLGLSSASTPAATQSWTNFFASAFLGSTEPGDQYHDGDEGDGSSDAEGDDAEASVGGEEEWQALPVEMVECEVPVKVWPGNTAFKATDVVLEV